MPTIDELRPLTALRLLTIRQAVRESGCEEEEWGLRCNAQVLAEACFSEGSRVFPDARKVLETLTAREMDILLERLRSAENPAPEPERCNPHFDAARFAALERGKG